MNCWVYYERVVQRIAGVFEVFDFCIFGFLRAVSFGNILKHPDCFQDVLYDVLLLLFKSSDWVAITLSGVLSPLTMKSALDLEVW